MNNKITNPYLKQLISEISDKTVKGRIVDVSWKVIEESKKRGKLKKEADAKSKNISTDKEKASKDGTSPLPQNPPAKDTKVAGLGDVPSTEQSAKTDLPSLDSAPQDPAAEKPSEKGPEGAADVEKAKADATKAKAELEKAKAEKDQAEKEIEQQSHVKLTSKAGVNFLLRKIIGDALKTNSIDAFAAELVDKLKLKDENDYALFVNEMAPFRIIPGIGELLASMKGLIGPGPSSEESNQ